MIKIHYLVLCVVFSIIAMVGVLSGWPIGLVSMCIIPAALGAVLLYVKPDINSTASKIATLCYSEADLYTNELVAKLKEKNIECLDFHKHIVYKIFVLMEWCEILMLTSLQTKSKHNTVIHIIETALSQEMLKLFTPHVANKLFGEDVYKKISSDQDLFMTIHASIESELNEHIHYVNTKYENLEAVLSLKLIYHFITSAVGYIGMTKEDILVITTTEEIVEIIKYMMTLKLSRLVNKHISYRSIIKRNIGLPVRFKQ